MKIKTDKNRQIKQKMSFKVMVLSLHEKIEKLELG
jgi:hypothetical protein